MQCRQQAIDAAAQTLAQERPECPHLRCEPLRQYGCCQIARKQEAIADQKPAGLVEPPMSGDKVGPGQAIAVEEDAQRPFARTNAAVANLAAAEAAVLVTHMLERDGDTRLPALDEACGLG